MSSWLRRLRFRARTLFGRSVLERQLDEELQFHLEMQTSANISLGLPPAAAQRLARQQFGSLTQHKDDYRDRWGARHLEAFCQDVRCGIRHAFARAGTSLAIVIVLALGLGAGTAVFAVFHGVLLQPLPYADADRLVRVKAHVEGSHGERLFSVPEIRDLRATASSFDGVAEFHFMYFILLDGQEPRRVSAGVVSANFFEVIGVVPAMGRDFTPEEEQEDAPRALVISDRFWKEQLDGDPHVIGRTFEMNDRVHTVVGVLPPLPAFPEAADIYLPTAACPLRASARAEQDRSMQLVSALARIAPTANDAGALGPRDLDPTVSTVPVRDDLVEGFRPTLRLLIASTAFLLLSLCSSVGALLVANVLRRRQDIAMMVALGAWKGRLFRQFSTEALVLSATGAVAGVGLAYAGLPLFVNLASRFTSRATDIRLDLTTLGFAAALAVAVSLLLGLIMIATVSSWLADPGFLGPDRGTPRRRPFFRGLVVAHIAVSFALLVGAGLILRSVLNLQRVDPGYRTSNLLTMRVSADFIEYRTFDSVSALFDRILGAIRAVPGVDAAAVSGALPLEESGNLGEYAIEIDGQPARPRPNVASLQIVSADYFRTVGVRLLDGREFNAGDNQQAARVAIVNQSMARHYWGDANPIGQHLRFVGGDWLEVVGVVADARQRLSAAAQDEVFRTMLQPSARQQAFVQARVLVRSATPPAVLQEQIRFAVKGVSSRQAVDSFQTLDDTREQQIVPMRLTALLVTVFAIIALAISAVGVGGVVGASVATRTRAFGLQMAVGATRGALLRSVLREGAVLAAGGLVAGLAFALPLSRALRGLLYGVTAYDPPTFAVVGSLLLVVTLAACTGPARRAASVDPNVALRA